MLVSTVDGDFHDPVVSRSASLSRRRVLQPKIWPMLLLVSGNEPYRFFSALALVWAKRWALGTRGTGLCHDSPAPLLQTRSRCPQGDACWSRPISCSLGLFRIPNGIMWQNEDASVIGCNVQMLFPLGVLYRDTVDMAAGGPGYSTSTSILL